MANEQNGKKIYIVLSQTGTVLSRLLHFITKKPYNHSSLSLNPELTRMYSFGRRNAYNPVWAGFVKESPHFGTFKRFPKTEIAVLALDVSEEVYAKVESHMEEMFSRRKKLHYNITGLVLAAFHVHYKPQNCYYCSEFVREVLVENDIEGADRFEPIIHPVDFLSLPGATVVYRGKLCDL